MGQGAQDIVPEDRDIRGVRGSPGQSSGGKPVILLRLQGAVSHTQSISQSADSRLVVVMSYSRFCPTPHRKMVLLASPTPALPQDTSPAFISVTASASLLSENSSSVLPWNLTVPALAEKIVPPPPGAVLSCIWIGSDAVPDTSRLPDPEARYTAPPMSSAWFDESEHPPEMCNCRLTTCSAPPLPTLLKLPLPLPLPLTLTLPLQIFRPAQLACMAVECRSKGGDAKLKSRKTLLPLLALIVS